MIKDEECPHCYGLGRIHSPLKNGDPDDDGVQCPRCEGTGVIEIDLNDFMEDE
jgi:hypothetical protein